jgi:thymidylate synthase (FAD)
MIEQLEYTPAAPSSSRKDPLGDGLSSVELVRVSGSDLDIVNAARVSYGKESQQFSERDRALIQFLMDHGHTSPFEHNQLSFRVKAPIFVTRQWMRHRINSYNEISYRYVKAPVEFYVPHQWRMQDTKNKQSSYGQFQDDKARQAYLEAVQKAFEVNNLLLELGVCREQARGVLPLCTYTEFFYTCNLTSLMHFIKLRTHEGAQWEIRVFAEALYELAYTHFPASLDAFKKKYGITHLHGPVSSAHADEFTGLLNV